MRLSISQVVLIAVAVGFSVFYFFSFANRSKATLNVPGFYNKPYQVCIISCAENFTNQPTNALLCQQNCLLVEQVFPGKNDCIAAFPYTPDVSAYKWTKSVGTGETTTGAAVE